MEYSKKKTICREQSIQTLLCVGLGPAFMPSAWHRVTKTGMHLKLRPEPRELVNAYTFSQLDVTGTRPENSSSRRGAHDKNHIKK